MILWAIGHVLGLDNLSGGFYGWWSGAGSDITELLSVSAGIGLIWHHVNCHEPGCYRVGRYHAAGGQWKVCGRHLPGGPPKAGQIALDHHHHLIRIGAHRDDTAERDR
jgi:hypothetical protein